MSATLRLLFGLELLRQKYFDKEMAMWKGAGEKENRNLENGNRFSKDWKKQKN